MVTGITLRSAPGLVLSICLASAALAAGELAQQSSPAFLGAEGFGAATVGGRGGKVLAATSLDNSRTGSWPAAVEARGPRIVVFRVGGTIALESPLRISHPDLTIAAQSAPGDGMPDEWESEFGLDPTLHCDGTGDADLDGYTNVEEFLNAADPRKPD